MVTIGRGALAAMTAAFAFPGPSWTPTLGIQAAYDTAAFELGFTGICQSGATIFATTSSSESAMELKIRKQ